VKRDHRATLPARNAYQRAPLWRGGASPKVGESSPGELSGLKPSRLRPAQIARRFSRAYQRPHG
jgi:hypothetical protein